MNPFYAIGTLTSIFIQCLIMFFLWKWLYSTQKRKRNKLSIFGYVIVGFLVAGWWFWMLRNFPIPAIILLIVVILKMLQYRRKNLIENKPIGIIVARKIKITVLTIIIGAVAIFLIICIAFAFM